MPKPVQRHQRYMPGLDGLRAVAVLAVIAYHLGFSWAPGGLLGVGVFFTLSGYLITDLLLHEWDSAGGLRLSHFWAARARRLLPALFIMLIAVAAWVTVFDSSQLPIMRGNSVAAIFYVSNWWLIIHNVSYFARFGLPSPLGNLWSLAIEEQFYLIWPWMLLIGLRFVRSRGVLALITIGLAAASAIEMGFLYHPGYDPSRVYYGTDTRAFALLIGAALAMLWPSYRLKWRTTRRAEGVLDLLGAVGLVVVGFLVWRTTEYSAFLYRGGMVLLSVATMFVVAAVVHPRTRLGKALGWGPLRWVGVRSYGIYLWQFPVIVLAVHAVAVPMGLVRAGVLATASVAIAAVSWKFVEDPIRNGALSSSAPALRRRPTRRVQARRLAVLAAVLAVVAVAVAGLLGAFNGSTVQSGAQNGPGTDVVSTHTTAPSTTTTTLHSTTTTHKGTHKGTTTTTRPVALAGHTSCKTVVDIGDSTSDGLVSPDYIPNAAQRLAAQYADVGVNSTYFEISGARSIVETLPGQLNGQAVVQQLKSQGVHGCWVIALGTNDAANVAVGSTVGYAARIDDMMSLIGNEPVMWVNVKSLLSSGPYANSNMQAWNQALVAACSRYPSMRIYDWASIVQTSWYISDGIHFDSVGYVARAKGFAAALATAFPAGGGKSPSCMVS